MLIKQKENSNWKEKVSQSPHLKKFFKEHPNSKHPVFGEMKKVNICQECGGIAEFSSYKNGKLEWAYCRECYGKRNKPNR